MRSLASSLLVLLLSSSALGAIGLPGGEVLVSDLTVDSAPFGRWGARIATNGDGFLLVWVDFRGIMASRLTAGGEIVDPVGIAIDADGFGAVDVVWAGSAYFVASGCPATGGSWQTAVCMSRVDRDGRVHRLPTHIEPATRPELAWNGRELLLVAALSNFIGASESLYAHRIGTDGSVISGFIPIGRGFTSAVTTIGEDFLIVWSWQGLFGRLIRGGVPGTRFDLAPPYEPHGLGFVDVAANGNEALVVWSMPDSGWSAASVRALRVSRDGVPIGAPALVPSEKVLNIYPSVSADRDGYVVSWTAANPNTIGGGAVRAVRVTRSGSVGQPFELASEAENGGEIAIASDGSRVVAAWTMFRGTVSDKSSIAQIRTALFDSVPLQRATISRSATWQDTAFGVLIAGRPFVTWSEIRGEAQQRVVLVKPLSEPGAGETVASSALDQLWPVISAGATAYVFWVELAPRAEEGSLFARSLDAQGRPAGPPLRIADAGESSIAAIVLGDLHYVFFSAKSGRIALIRLRNDGTLLDSQPLEITNFAVDDVAHLDPSVSTDGSTILLAWRASYVPRCAALCVAMTAVDVAPVSREGVLIAPPTRLTHATGGYSETVWNGSEFVVFWDGIIGTSYGINARRYDRLGNAVSAAVPIVPNASLTRRGALWNGRQFIVASSNQQKGGAAVHHIQGDLTLARSTPLPQARPSLSSPGLVLLNSEVSLVLYEREFEEQPFAGISRLVARFLDLRTRTRAVGRR